VKATCKSKWLFRVLGTLLAYIRLFFMKSLTKLAAIMTFMVLLGCTESFDQKTGTFEKLFTVVPASVSGVYFQNTIDQNLKFNALIYPYAYNGAGVAVGDLNNDGLEDIYLVSNQHSNKLYLNQGDFKFKDATQSAGVSDEGGWSTGVTLIDINNDGWLDIYVCKSASMEDEGLRRNRLYVNQRNGRFTEEAAKWGLDNNGFSTQAYFLDYDKDGDLDMYLLNHRHDFALANNLEDRHDRKYFSETSDHLYRNEGVVFKDVTLESGVRNKEFGLSAAIGDFNDDGWPDIYVANDLITPDYLYINNQDGTFSNQIRDRFRHTSYTSMGSDYADINNDLKPDLLVLDMSAEDHRRGKQNMPSMNTAGFWKMVNGGYHYSYMSNMLNLNNGNGFFTDIAQMAGISKTDWSWAALIADYDCDGFKDILVTNGLEHELGNQDYRRKLSALTNEKQTLSIDEILSTMPSEKLMNYAFKNNGDLTFDKASAEWGFDQKINSNGIAYGDFDNDGDLDIVLNNLQEEATVYENHSIGNYIRIALTGDARNINAIGAGVKVYTESGQQYQELYLSRGYLSSVSKVLLFGLGAEKVVKRIEVIWGDGSVLAAEDVGANQTLTFDKKDFKWDGELNSPMQHFFAELNPDQLGLKFEHKENVYNDFSRQVLLPKKQSEKGPALAVTDLNGDGFSDLYIGGAVGQHGQVYLQSADGNFHELPQPSLVADRDYEDNKAIFFDADGDGDPDLYVASGGYELTEGSEMLQDRLYLNNGEGIFTRSGGLPAMPGITGAVASSDFDQDGDMDLVVGGQVIPGRYPLFSESFLLENSGGRFRDVTQERAPELSNVGLVNDLLFTDFNGDGEMDIVVVGEWFPITFFRNREGHFLKEEVAGLEYSSGWWNTVREVDLDQDGDVDYLVGNLGENNKFHPSEQQPLHVYSTNLRDDDNYDMFLSKSYQGNLVPVRGKECSTEQNPFVSEKIESFEAFANATLFDIYGEQTIEGADHKMVYEFASAYLENQNGRFQLKRLPTPAQFGPTLAFEIFDVNGDGHLDVIGAGAIYEAEVETVRYDGNTGYLLLGDSNGNLRAFPDNSFFTKGNIKNMRSLEIAGSKHIILGANNSPVELFKVIDRAN